MLVGAFQVHDLVAGLRCQFGTLVDHGEMGDPGIEPDIEHVGDLLVAIGLVAEQLARIEAVPGVDAVLLDMPGDLLEQFSAAWVRQLGSLVDEQGDRHAPGALARDAPVGTSGDHAGDALLAPGRNPAYFLDRLQRGRPQPFLFHADEPLRRGPERHRRLVPPAMRIAVFELRMGEQMAVLAQQFGDRVVGLPDELAFDHRRTGQVDAVAADRIEFGGAVFLDQSINRGDREVLDAVARRGVHGAGSVLGGHVIAEQERNFALVERVAQHGRAPLPPGEGLG